MAEALLLSSCAFPANCLMLSFCPTFSFFASSLLASTSTWNDSSGVMTERTFWPERHLRVNIKGLLPLGCLYNTYAMRLCNISPQKGECMQSIIGLHQLDT